MVNNIFFNTIGQFRPFNLPPECDYYMDTSSRKNLTQANLGTTHLKNLHYLGLRDSAQQRIGALVVYCGMFENEIAQAIWKLSGENPAGQRASTEGKPISTLVSRLKNYAVNQPDVLKQVIELVCDLAEDLAEYRNTIVHGFVFGFPATEAVFFRGFSIEGETFKRPVFAAFAHDEWLDLAIDAASAMHMALFAVNRDKNVAPVKEDYLHVADRLTLVKESVRTLRDWTVKAREVSASTPPQSPPPGFAPT